MRVLTLGEIMLRFSTQSSERLIQSEALAVHYGGGEANVAISLANYQHETFFASKVPDNTLGEAVKKHLRQYNVDVRHLKMGGSRLGTYYVESGVGQRASTVVYDRAYSSFAQMTLAEWELDELFASIDLFHISGITPALSAVWAEQTLQLMQAAKARGVKISFDINYRGKLWTQAQASEVIQQLLPYVDYCSAGKMDAIYLLNIEPCDSEKELIYYYQQIQQQFPNLQVLYSTKREVISSSVNQLQGTLWMNETYYESKQHLIDPIVDRIGGGDAFSGGVLHGLLQGDDPQHLIDFATAAAVLKHSVAGDCNQFSATEVQEFLQAESGKIVR